MDTDEIQVIHYDQFLCRDCIGNIIYLSCKPIGYFAIMVAETLAIGETNQMNQGNIIVEIDS